MSRPKLLVLDEPSMGLAPRIVQQIFQTLKQLNESEGLSILVAEQNSTVALQYANRVAVLETGTTVLEGSAAELRDRSDIKDFYLGESVSFDHEMVQENSRLGGIASSSGAAGLLPKPRPCRDGGRKCIVEFGTSSRRADRTPTVRLLQHSITPKPQRTHS